MRKTLNLFMVVVAFFIGTNTSYGKKVKYANNIYYEGEVTKVGKTWQPMGKGVLYFMNKGTNSTITHFKITGDFNNTEIDNATFFSVKRQEGESSIALGKQNEIVFEGEMSFAVYAVEDLSLDGFVLPGIKGDGDIGLSFEKGKFLFPEVGNIETFEPFSIIYNKRGDFDGNYFPATLSRNEKMHLFDPYGVKSGVPYQVSANVKISLGWDAVYCVAKESKVKWEDGSEAVIRPILQVTRGNHRWWDIFAAEGDYISETDDIAVLARYNENEYVVYPDLKTNDYIMSAFKSRFRRILSDGTIVSGVHEENTPHIRYIKCTDGRVFKSTKGVGATVKGGETVKLLFTNQTLTKEDITFVGGTLYDTEGEEVDTFGAGVGVYGELPHF